MKNILSAVAVSLALTAAVTLPASAQQNWSGPYVGANLGGGINLNNGGERCYDAGVLSAPGCRATPYSGSNGSGILGGLQAGYNFRFSPLFVLGAETDFQGANIVSKASQAGTYPFFSGGTSTTLATFLNKQSINWLGTLRGRLGYAGFDNFLVYGTGGLMYGQESLGTTYSVQNFGTFSAYKNQVNLGWVAGAGVEYALTNHISVKGEALYYDAGTTTLTTNQIGVFQHQVDFAMRGPIFRIGVNWAFGAPEAPPASAPVVAAPAPRPAAVVPSQQMFIVFFEFDKSALTADGKKVVDAAAAAFKSGKSGVAIAGYTDLSGTQTYNLALSHRRADVVKSALVKDGVPAAAVSEAWHGKENPRVPTADGVREPQNRRVEITM